MDVRIPKPVQDELANPAGEGDRHRQMKDTVKSLLGNVMSPQAVFAQYRSMYDDDVPDHEIWKVINWAAGKNPQPSGYSNGVSMPSHWNGQRKESRPKHRPKAIGEEAIQNARDWLCGFSCDEADLWDLSKVAFTGDWQKDGLLFLRTLHADDALVCINTDYGIDTKKDGAEKAYITGAGITMCVGEWAAVIREFGAPCGEAGVWVRLNSLKDEEGSGHGGAHTDNDVADFLYLLVENDILPIDLQLSVLGKIKLPIAAIYSSGGASVHAAVRLAAPDIAAYRVSAAEIMNHLLFMGFDQSNTNPSRYSRLPGCLRKIGAHGDGQQRLLYLDPDPQPRKAIFQ